MARELPAIPDNKVQFYRDKLIREVSNLFIWEGLPNEIPADYLERSLILHGTVMFFYDDKAYGYMALRAGTRGFNLYDQPTEAFTNQPNDSGLPTAYTRVICHRYDEDIPKENACVLINNMYKGESLRSIIDHYAYRLALIQQAFDTNAIWQNTPVIFQTDDSNIKLSIESMFSDIFEGKPWVIVDKVLYAKDKNGQAEPIEVPFLLDKLADAKNVVYNEFKATIGIDSVAVDKKERLLTGEIESNKQSTQTCLQIMLGQREIACKEIEQVFGIKPTVRILESGVDEDGKGDDGTEDLLDDEEL